MDPLIYTAVSGANRTLSQQQISANNLANANTQGFRADLEQANSRQVTGTGFDTRYLVQGQNGGVDMTPGSIHQTGRELDVAIQGNGLIALQNGGREVYTRNGAIEIDPDGNLTVGGLPVLGDGGPIVLPPYSSVAIGRDGTITITPDDGDMSAAMDVDRIKLVDIPANQLNKNETGLLISNNRAAARSEMVQVVGKHLESSNVSAITEMVSTVSLNRQFEAQIKMMKAAEELAQAGNKLLRNS
ncbi:flagellar basal-body rod protein FlgF [Pragia fontium]|uniref:Flagellar basal-body rod protein FlgF n=2 Tax=Pragia fontium TaxID=82985 RepID=A0AAJ5BFR6_9GAMM|nr:flagellar basal-body rod protein FlgF [Pragia fontium]AKJ41387.1 flagellar basal body rod protein FlgF [Pragia fontium]SFC01538.1 flagellar basal-body rod protein FlgF [Pragia fontium DSM 5563 = ATCC 49100]SUB81636.1 Putative proximal rod protein [Pragia fontium]VEJ54110.1 Putative proximal rod protein [Pragia fontium]GKX62943.1 flagellar basal body protein [Pragia fontium]